MTLKRLWESSLPLYWICMIWWSTKGVFHSLKCVSSDNGKALTRRAVYHSIGLRRGVVVFKRRPLTQIRGSGVAFTKSVAYHYIGLIWGVVVLKRLPLTQVSLKKYWRWFHKESYLPLYRTYRRSCNLQEVSIHSSESSKIVMRLLQEELFTAILDSQEVLWSSIGFHSLK